jgi:hypothetical protein
MRWASEEPVRAGRKWFCTISIIIDAKISYMRGPSLWSGQALHHTPAWQDPAIGPALAQPSAQAQHILPRCSPISISKATRLKAEKSFTRGRSPCWSTPCHPTDAHNTTMQRRGKDRQAETAAAQAAACKKRMQQLRAQLASLLQARPPHQRRGRSGTPSLLPCLSLCPLLLALLARQHASTLGLQCRVVCC